MSFSRSKHIIVLTIPEYMGQWADLIAQTKSAALEQRIVLEFLVHTISVSDQKSLEAYTREFEAWYAALPIDKKQAKLLFAGHQLGGVILASFLTDRLESGRGSDFFNLEQLFFIDSPELIQGGQHDHSEPVSTWTDSLSSLRGSMLEQLIEADEFTEYSRPVPIRWFLSRADGFGSKQTSLRDCSALEIIDIEESRDGVIRALAGELYFNCWLTTLEAPFPHKGVFQVARLETFIKVEPFAEREVEIGLEGASRKLLVSSHGWVNRTIHFSERNKCDRLYTIRYGVENPRGAIIGEVAGGENQATELEVEEYLRKQKEFIFSFFPEAGETYALNVELFNGFNEDYRDAHFHLGGGEILYEQLEYILDLSDFLSAGWQITEAPTLMLHPENMHSCENRFDERKHVENTVAPSEAEQGIWKWTLQQVTSGVVDIFWDVKFGEKR